ncbi:hypothetical protein [Pukyongiella litopenaei]|uniref:Uncharacterized protein n=1 Tax=Pukyongiella litopenaei TaxID=2605946 RepID=A0A2S0MNV2_9RHOB|nr:hypothetical protein [Pukyongiella litopenaei]AVO37569.1 hypothetical protein C6Y53_07540 [Pukyongiella litopenaei]
MAGFDDLGPLPISASDLDVLEDIKAALDTDVRLASVFGSRNPTINMVEGNNSELIVRVTLDAALQQLLSAVGKSTPQKRTVVILNNGQAIEQSSLSKVEAIQKAIRDEVDKALMEFFKGRDISKKARYRDFLAKTVSKQVAVYVPHLPENHQKITVVVS